MLGVSVHILPDLVLQSPHVLFEAEDYIETRVPDWATVMAGTDVHRQTNLKLAIQCRMALDCISRLKQQARSGEKVGEFTSGTISWDGVADDMLAAMESSIVGARGGTDDATPTVFELAGPSRRYYELKDSNQTKDLPYQNV